MQWSDVLNDPSLKNLTYKIELKEKSVFILIKERERFGFAVKMAK